MVPHYRIISNGTTYRVQRRLLFIWWTLRGGRRANLNFHDQRSARVYVKSLMDAWEAKHKNWKVIEDVKSDGLK